MDCAAWSLEEATASTSTPTGRAVKAGDLVIIYEGYQSLKAAYMDLKKCHNCYAGAFLHKVRLHANAWHCRDDYLFAAHWTVQTLCRP